MYLKTTQKYFAIRDKFSIVNANDVEVFFAESFFKFRQNCSLYTINGALVYELEAKIASIFGRYYIKDATGNPVGVLQGKAHKPFVQKWRLELGGKKYLLRSGGYHTKIFAVDDKWKYNKKTDKVGMIKKKISKIRDTYEIDFDENRLNVSCAAICMIWMDCRFHSNQH